MHLIMSTIDYIPTPAGLTHPHHAPPQEYHRLYTHSSSMLAVMRPPRVLLTNNNNNTHLLCALINALSAHMIHTNLNMIFYTHVEHSSTQTIRTKHHMERRPPATQHTHMNKNHNEFSLSVQHPPPPLPSLPRSFPYPAPTPTDSHLTRSTTG